MKTIVITGSTRGIGFGLAGEFLKRDCNVVVSGRTQVGVGAALAKLASDHAHGITCDVADYAQVQRLWDESVKPSGRVDIWINNAGISTIRKPIWEQSPDDMRAIVGINVLGVMFGSQVAVKGMLAQGGGQVWNMEGFGSDGMVRDGMALYGTTKSAVSYFTRSLIKELEGKPVQAGYLSPGIVATELTKDNYAEQPEVWEKAKRTLNILGDTVETVTPYLAEKILATNANGAKVAWLTMPKVIGRFLTSPFNKRVIY